MWSWSLAGDQGEGHGQVLERVGGQQQGVAAQVQLVDAQGAAEAVEDPAAVVGHVEPPDLPVEAVVDEAVGEVQEEVPAHRGDDPLDAHAVVEEAVEDGLADRVVVQRPGLDARRRGAEGRAAAAAGPVLAVGDVEEDDLLVGDGPDLAVVGGLAPPELAARRFKSDVFRVTLRTLIGPAFERVHAGHSFLAWGLSSARKACTPRAPASAGAAHPSTTPWDSSPLGGGARSADTAGGSGRTGATPSSPPPGAAAGRSSSAVGC